MLINLAQALGTFAGVAALVLVRAASEARLRIADVEEMEDR